MMPFINALAESIADLHLNGAAGAREISEAALDLASRRGGKKEISLLSYAVKRVLKRRGPLQAKAEVPFPIDEKYIKTIKETISNSIGKPVELEVKEDRDLIGGARLTVGDERIDLSLKGALQSFSLSSSPFQK